MQTLVLCWFMHKFSVLFNLTWWLLGRVCSAAHWPCLICPPHLTPPCCLACDWRCMCVCVSFELHPNRRPGCTSAELQTQLCGHGWPEGLSLFSCSSSALKWRCLLQCVSGELAADPGVMNGLSPSPFLTLPICSWSPVLWSQGGGSVGLEVCVCVCVCWETVDVIFPGVLVVASSAVGVCVLILLCLWVIWDLDLYNEEILSIPDFFRRLCES